MQKQRISLIVGLVLAVVVVFLIKAYLDQQRQIIKEEEARQAAQTTSAQANQIAVLVAKQNIPKGAIIKLEMLETKTFPKEYVVPQAVITFDRIKDMVTVTDISQGEQITLTRLAYAKQAGGLAEVTPVGKRAITINVDNIASVGGMINPGDYVDLIANLPVPVQTPDGKQTTQVASIPLFQNVLVLAVGQEIGGLTPASETRYKEGEEGAKQQRREPSPLITIALSPQEANLVAFVQDQGKFRLVLRSPADSQMQPLTPIDWNTLFQYLAPKPEVKPEVSKEASKEQEPTEFVEVYRGLRKEKMPLSK